MSCTRGSRFRPVAAALRARPADGHLAGILAGVGGLKRALDFCLALALIVVTLPITACIVRCGRATRGL